MRGQREVTQTQRVPPANLLLKGFPIILSPSISPLLPCTTGSRPCAQNSGSLNVSMATEQGAWKSAHTPFDTKNPDVYVKSGHAESGNGLLT